MKATPSAIAFVALLGSLAAQNISVSLSALTPLSLTATEGSQVYTATSPAGPLASFGSLRTSVPSAPLQSVVEVGWNTENLGGGAVGVIVAHTLDTLVSPGATMQTGAQEFLVEFTASSPVSVQFGIERQSTISSGTAWPSVAIDIDNDGTIDLPDVGVYPGPPVTLGTQTKRWRILMSSSVQGAQRTTTTVTLGVHPANDLYFTQSVATCAPPDVRLHIVPSLVNRGADFGTEWTSFAADVLVLGFQPQPVLIPAPSPFPCLLLPSPDILLVVPFLGVHLDLPAAVRPVTFYAQAVRVSLLGELRTTEGYTVVAN